MSVLSDLTEAIRDGSIDVIDLTAPLSRPTPVIKLPPPFGNTATFALHEISRYDDRGPAWYWNDITTGEHTGTHFDAPVHWVTGKDGADVAQVPVRRLIAPAVVLDFAAQAAADPDFLLEIGMSSSGRPRTARCRRAAGCSTGPAGTPGRPASRSSSTPTRPARTRRGSRWPAPSGWRPGAELIGLGVETVGTDAGAAHSFDPPFPCHASLLGAGKYGLTQLQNRPGCQLGARCVITGPLPITGGSGSPCRAIALVERAARASLMLVTDAVAATLAGLGADTLFGVVGSGNFQLTNALISQGTR